MASTKETQCDSYIRRKETPASRRFLRQPSSCFNATKLEDLIFCDLLKTCSFSQLFAVLLSLRCGKPMHSPRTAVSQHPPLVSLSTHEKSLVWNLLGPLWEKALRSVFTS